VHNDSTSALQIDALHAQDLGLADEAVVRNNEAYVSQYLDLLPVAHPALGWIVLARQNQAMTAGVTLARSGRVPAPRPSARMGGSSSASITSER